MTWKVHPDSKPVGDLAHLHLFDPTCQLHLDTHLLGGWMDLYIGSDDPAEARLWVRIDSDADPGEDPIELHHAKDFSHRDVAILDNVLGTIGCSEAKRRRFAKPLRRALHEKRAPEVLRT